MFDLLYANAFTFNFVKSKFWHLVNMNVLHESLNMIVKAGKLLSHSFVVV